MCAVVMFAGGKLLPSGLLGGLKLGNDLKVNLVLQMNW